MTLLIRENKKHICNVVFINVISKVVLSNVFISIFIVSLLSKNGLNLDDKMSFTFLVDKMPFDNLPSLGSGLVPF